LKKPRFNSITAITLRVKKKRSLDLYRFMKQQQHPQQHLEPAQVTKPLATQELFKGMTGHEPLAIEPRKKTIIYYFPLNPGWLIPGSLFHGL